MSNQTQSVFDRKLDHAFANELIQLVKYACTDTTDWQSFDTDDFKISNLGGGLSNRLFVLSLKNKKVGLIRIFNKHAVLTNDPKMGIYRHADAGYEDAIENSKKWDIKIPMLKK